MSTPLIIRTASLADMADLTALQHAAFSEIAARDYGAHTVREILAVVPLLTEALVAEGHYFAGVDAAGQIIVSGGWSMAPPAYDVAIPGAEEPRGPEPVIRSVYVRPDAARQGLGAAIMGHIEADMRAHGVTVATLTATLSGLPLYERLGYRRTGDTFAELPSGRRVQLVNMKRPLGAVPGLAA